MIAFQNITLKHTAHATGLIFYDDVMTWIYFPHYCPFVQGIADYRGILSTKSL